MHRFLKALLLLVTCTLLSSAAFAQTLPISQVSGRLGQGQLRVFVKDTLYRITGQYTIAGTLLIEPGTTIEFITNGRLIDSVGGRIIADGDLQAIWNRNTSDVANFPNRYCDTGYIRANVAIGARPEVTVTGPSYMDIVPHILFFYANGRNRCGSDPNLANTPYRRNVVRAPIIFRGRPVNANSPEWGHIVILPGADTAFFRNVQFVNFRKETRAVSITDFYAPNAQNGYNANQINAGTTLNAAMRNLTTGGGGALTTFSSKTWLLDCRFDSNFARHHGGAVQFLQAPFDPTGLFYRPAPGLLVAPAAYPATNPESFDIYGGVVNTPFGPINALTPTTPAGATVQYRQTYDDGRMAINRGRVRRLTFRDNRAVVSDTTDDVNGFRDETTPEGLYPVGNPAELRKNEAFGGAMYISGRRLITVFLGHGAALDSMGILPGGDPTDSMVFERNHAVNYQSANPASNGARGGAIYVGDSTSMHFQHSRFAGNFTAAPNVDPAAYLDRGRMSQGGGIYMSETSPVLTAVGNVRFTNNKSGQGGAMYIAAVGNPASDFYLSPVLGDSAYFISNKAEYDGGAIYTQRNTLFAAPFLITLDSTLPGLPMVDRRILFDSNAAGLAGGAVVIDNRTSPQLSRARVENVLFRQNAVDSAMVADVRQIKLYNPLLSPMGPGNENATHTVLDVYNMPPSIVVEVLGGGAIYSLNGNTNFFRSVEFLENRARFGNGGAISMILPGMRDNRYFLSAGDSAYDFNAGTGIPFIDGPEPTDQRQMTRFLDNVAEMDMVNLPATQNPHGSTLGDAGRNGTGLGGAIYINDMQSQGGVGTPRTDSVLLHRVRVQANEAWSGSAVYSDNYDLRVVFNKSLVANNAAISTIGANVDVIQNYRLSDAASPIAGATFYGEIEGPMPSNEYHINANSIYDNSARFIIRLPDAPANGTGFGGVDTLRGNFWGRTEAPVTTVLPSGTLQNTFYIQGDSCTLPLKNPAIPEQQGPFESARKLGDAPGSYYTYTPVPIGVIPDTLLFQGRVYDIFDKGRDIKAVDYSNPRMSPIEDFAVGIPKRLLRFPTGVYANKVVRRLTRDPFIADTDSLYALLQREFVGNHPIGYPLFLDSRANYIGAADTVNDNRYSLDYTVFYVINIETGEMVRSNSRQLAEGGNVFRSRVEFVADSINRDPLQRRTYEGRAAFSIGEIARLAPQYYMETPGLLGTFANRTDSLRAARLAAAGYEDSLSITGRRYGGRITPVLELGGNGFTYENRNNPPTFVDVYAGERYRALPVLAGDRIWVISRTEMWNTNKSITQVVNDARFTGLEFMIDNNNSIAAPVIFGQRDSLENRQPAELRNSRFLIEDTMYTASDIVADTSKIFEVTANDLNGFFDPRSIFFPDRFTALRFEYNTLQEFPGGLTIPNNSPAAVRLASWLKADTVFPSDVINRRDSARGFLRFYGTPHNPDVVPGGELLEVRVSNYPPGIRTIDSLRGLLSADTISRYVFLYPPYFNCQVYDAQRARYLQQDTVDIGGSTTTSYRLRIFVQDTPPVFLADVAPCYPSDLDLPNLAVANLTDQLRFDFDVNTDDEMEDNNAAAENWTFPYGRTTYGFVFTDRNIPAPGDSNATDDVREVRPVWLADNYLRDDTRVPDRGVSVLTQGKIIVRIDSATAIELLRNPAQANNAFNLDTVFTIVANDGHTGQNKRDMRAIVNVAPQLQPVPGIGDPLPTLPRAKEDRDYNPQLLDRTRGVVATDLNLNQRLRYYLVYRNDQLNRDIYRTGTSVLDRNGTPVTNTSSRAFVRRDGCYFEAGLFTAPKSTPDWLKVNTNSGLLFGTPGLNDAPRTTATGGPDTVTVVVEDEFGLTDVRRYVLEVDSTQHRPRLVGRPAIQCVEPNSAYVDSLCVSDRDLGRARFNERLTLEVVSPAGFTVSPSVITGNGNLNPDSCQMIRITAPRVVGSGRVRVVIRVTDAAGNTDELAYEIIVSEPVIFSMPVRIRNTNAESGSNATQEMVFGIARNATTGEDPSALGRLDSVYCEYELPPQPPRDVFDARWTIPTRTGVLRNIYPENPSAGQGVLTWKGLFQPGFLEGGSVNYPIVICWSITDARRAPKNIHIMDPLAGSVFRIDMKNPTGAGVKLVPGGGVTLRINGDTACVEILASSSLEGYHITYDLTNSVSEPVTGAAGYTLSANAPNPFSNTTEITFFAPKRGDMKLEVFNINGELVNTLVNSSTEAGRHSVIWNGTDEKGNAVASGTYTYRLTAGPNVITRTMVLVK